MIRPDVIRSIDAMSIAAAALCILASAGCSAKKNPATHAAAGSARAASKGPCPAPIPGSETLTGSIVVLGELHGTAEIPAAFASLVCDAASRKPKGTLLVGLEIPASAQGAIDEFMKTDGGAAATVALLAGGHWQREYQDGRSSEALLRLLDDLRRFRAAKLDIEVRAIDDMLARTAAERDARMAAAVNKGIADVLPKQTLVLVGDVLSRVVSGYPWSPADPYLPLGALLRATHDDVIGLNVTSGGGSAWICRSASASECGVIEIKQRALEGETPRFELRPDGLAKTGWSGTLHLAALSASSPARDRR